MALGARAVRFDTLPLLSAAAATQQRDALFYFDHPTIHLSPHRAGPIPEFFARNGFDSRAHAACNTFARARFPDASLEAVEPQGYCSYTLNISKEYLMQFRPEGYRLEMQVCEQARSVYGELVPRVVYLGPVPGIYAATKDTVPKQQLHVYLQERIPGVTLDKLHHMSGIWGDTQQAFRRTLMKDLAAVFATGLRHGRTGDHVTKGQVGKSLRWRLKVLKGLPDGDLCETVDEIAAAIDAIEDLPWCLTHGDLVPANIMVDPDSGRLTGLIDWAEGEWLPFGVGLYGLEEALGCEHESGEFRFFPEHELLREQFWTALQDQGVVSSAAHSSSWLQTTCLAQKLGILLWRGMAFDDGRIDRVVEQGRDDYELQKLRLFLKSRDSGDEKDTQ